MKRTRILAIMVLAFGLMGLCSLAMAGDLEPTDPLASTMKTLDEVEPRVPIHAADLPLTITEPKSYYLVEDVNFTDTGNDAITVECNNVTIDLMGYTLKGPDSGTGYGIYMDGRTNVEIRNGTVRDFYYGIYESSSSGQDHQIVDVRSLSNGRRGIYLNGYGHLVKDCTASDNGISATGTVYSIHVGYGSMVTGNTVYNNGNLAVGTVFGIEASYDNTITNNVLRNNGNLADGYVYGIKTYSGCTVTGNTASSNGNSADGAVYGICTSSGCTVTGNTTSSNGDSATGSVYGIRTSSGCTIIGNTVRNSGDLATGSYVYGISVGSGSTVIGNTAYSNGTGASGTVYGIYLSGNNLVDQNTAYDNDGTNMDTNKSDCTYGINRAP